MLITCLRSGNDFIITLGVEPSMNSKNIEVALKASEIRYRRLFETAQDGILIVDAETGQIDDVNPFLMNLLGYTHEEILGKKLWEVGFIKDIEAARSAFKELQEKTYIRFEDLPLETKGGRSIAVEFVSNVYWVNGVKVIQCNIRDITDRKLLEQQKEDFYAMVTHDIKSPLTVILSYAELLLTDDKYNLGKEAKEFITAIEKSGHKILRLAEGFLDLSRLQSGGITLNNSMVDVAGLLREVYEDLEQSAREAELEFYLQLPEEHIVCMLDNKYVGLAVRNLVENALKYTSSGSVTLTAVRQTGSGGDFVVISVSDTGPGIPKEHLGKIFHKYYRSPRTADVKGTGLGLAIVKEVVDIHGGRVTVDCPESGGCTFKLFLPAGSSNP